MIRAPQTGKNHLPSRSLQNTGNNNVHRQSRTPPGILNHHHCSIIEITDPLVVFLTLFNYLHTYRFTRQDHGLRRIRQLAMENEKTVYVFCEDAAASGGYYLALAGDEIYADPSSIIGSIGVIFAGFGLGKARYAVKSRAPQTAHIAPPARGREGMQHDYRQHVGEVFRAAN